MPMTISIDDGLKQEFSTVCQEIGLSPSAAFTVFAKAVVRERGFPFELTTETFDMRAMRATQHLEAERRAYEDELVERLWMAQRDVDEGRLLSRSEVLDYWKEHSRS